MKAVIDQFEGQEIWEGVNCDCEFTEPVMARDRSLSPQEISDRYLEKLEPRIVAHQAVCSRKTGWSPMYEDGALFGGWTRG